MRLTKRKTSILPIESKLKLRVLDDEQIKKIHEGTLLILEEVGIHFPSEKALKIFRDSGAAVDFNGGIVKMPRELVMRNLKKAPRFFRLAARGEEELDLNLNDKQTFFATGGCGVTTVDRKTRERRPSSKEDVALMARIADYLPAISFFYGPIVSAQDKLKTAPLHELDAAFNNTEKHVQTETMMGEGLAKIAVDIASMITGDKEKLRKRPILSELICCVQPLAQDKEGIESALIFAETGLPVGFMSMPTFGATSPAGQAGALAMGMAEVISGIVLLQIAYPGTPVFVSIIPGVIDPRSGDYFYGSALSQITNAAAVQLAHFYGVPIQNGASFGGGNPEINSWQVGRENVYLPLLSVLSGAETAFGLGLMDSVTLLYPERILFDEEIFQTVLQISKGIEVSENTLALDVIRRVGPRGHFLGEKHTRENVRNFWTKSLVNERSSREGEAYRDPWKVAMEELEWVIENHHPAELDEKLRAEITKRLIFADRELG